MPIKVLLLLPVACFLFSFKTGKKTTRVVFFGDSITQAAVNAGGYIAQMHDSLAAQNRADQFDLVGAGISGNKIYDLYLRLEDDVLAKKPDAVFVFVGVNDVWHKRTHGTGTDADKFQKFYAAVVRKLQDAGIRVVLCTPLCIGERGDCSNPLDGELNLYSQIIRNLAKEKNCGLCDFRQIFLNYSAQHNPDNLERGILTTDGVHLNEKGNAVVAQAMLKHL
jgi:lysophospholipase L1-like esterase